MRAVVTVLIAGVAITGPALAQEKKAPPVVYWMNAATGEGAMMGAAMAGMNLGAMMNPGMMGNMGGLAGMRDDPRKQRSLTLQLASPQAPAAAPQAAHDIPTAMNMGASLPLKTPQRERTAPAGRSSPGADGAPEKPEGKITLYWGCGAQVRSGQPKVFDMAAMNAAEFAKAFAGRSARQQPPSGRTVGLWPNPESSLAVPATASLQGAHRISGNYTPEIKFNVGPAQDFMAPVKLAIQGSAADAMVLSWEAIPTAIGQFVSAMSSDDKGGMVVWSSSNVQEPGWGLHDYLPSAEVDKWVKDGVLLPPATTTCTIPKGIFAKAGGGMLRFTAYGRELNVGWPEKPKDPEWAVKLRLKTTAMLPLDETEQAEEEDEIQDVAPGPAPAGAGSPANTAGQAQPAAAPGNPAADIGKVLDAGSKLMGLFGR